MILRPLNVRTVTERSEHVSNRAVETPGDGVYGLIRVDGHLAWGGGMEADRERK